FLHDVRVHPRGRLIFGAEEGDVFGVPLLDIFEEIPGVIDELWVVEQVEGRQRVDLGPGHRALVGDRGRDGDGGAPVVDGDAGNIGGDLDVRRWHHPGDVAHVI